MNVRFCSLWFLCFLFLTNIHCFKYTLSDFLNAEGPPPKPDESPLKDEDTPPAPPQNFVAEASDGQVRLTWDSQEGLTYDLFHSTSAGFELTSGMKLSPVTSPYTHDGLTADTTYYYRLTANNAAGASEPTNEVSARTPATPLATPPATPQNFMATASAAISNTRVTLNWDPQRGVTSYDLFYATAAGIDVESSTAAKFTNVTPPYNHTGLTNNTTYYYRLTANNRFGKSEPTGEISATPELQVEQVSAGWEHTCAVVNGAAACWGAGADGRLGHNETANRNADKSEPTQVYGLTSGVTQISAGGRHTCAVVNGAAFCWGRNASGQVGNGSSSVVGVSAPQQVNGLGSGVTQISTGGGHTCAVVNGAAKCWGWGNSGRLGTGNISNQRTPQQVNGLGSGVTQITAGNTHTCAVVGGAAKCWGSGIQGQVGNGGNSGSSTPVQVTGLTSRVTKITAGGRHACAVVDGAAFCWGEGDNGRLGHNETANRNADKSTPTQVEGLTSGVTQITGGDNHTCAVVDGAAKCWGDGGSGRLGNGGSGASAPQQVNDLTSRVTQISAGREHTCAVVDRSAKCWGNGGNGRLGNGGSGANTPQQVSGL